MKKTLALILFAILSQYCFSIDIKGKITDTEHKPIRYANIIIENTSMGIISNEDGLFELKIPEKYSSRHIIISCIGFKTKRIKITDFKVSQINNIILDYNVVDLKEIRISAKAISVNEVVQKAFDNYYKNFPTEPFIAKGFLRHTEKTQKKYKWLIESAITMYDNSEAHEKAKIKLHVNETRRSYDHRSIDSLSLYKFYLMDTKNKSYSVFKSRNAKKIRDTVSNAELIKAVMYNDLRTNGLNKIFNGQKNIANNRKNFDNGNQNIIRNYGSLGAMFDENIFKKHQFSLDTVLAEGERFLYKIKISPHPKMVNLNAVLKKRYAPIGWIYIYNDNYAIKELEYALIAASHGAKLRNSLTFDTPIHYKVSLKYIEYNGKMYLNYFSCNVPKMLRTTASLDDPIEEVEQYYYTKQEILFTEIITDKEKIKQRLGEKWNDNLFEPRPYNKAFWENYNILLESKNQEKMINDLEKEVKLKKQFLEGEIEK